MADISIAVRHGAGPGVATTERFIYDGDQIVHAFDGAGSLTNRAIYGPLPDQVLVEEQISPSMPVTLVWALTDHIGSVRDLVSSTGIDAIKQGQVGEWLKDTIRQFSLGVTEPVRDFAVDPLGSLVNVYRGMKQLLTHPIVTLEAMKVQYEQNPAKFAGNMVLAFFTGKILQPVAGQALQKAAPLVKRLAVVGKPIGKLTAYAPVVVSSFAAAFQSVKNWVSGVIQRVKAFFAPGRLGNPSQFVKSRVGELQTAIPAGSKGRTTMGVAVVEDASGTRSVLISTSEPRGYLRPGVTLKPGERMVVGTGHAEADIIAYAKANNLKVIDIGATKPVCPNCVEVITPSGANISTPLKKPPQ